MEEFITTLPSSIVVMYFSLIVAFAVLFSICGFSKTLALYFFNAIAFASLGYWNGTRPNTNEKEPTHEQDCNHAANSNTNAIPINWTNI